MIYGIGSKGVAVAVIQQLLKDAGFAIEVDGKYGPGTASVVKQFQTQQGIGVDGKVGPETLRTLGYGPDLFQPTLSTWQELTSFRPPAAVQQRVKNKGVLWHVHRIEDGWGDLNLDFYPVRIDKLPVIDGAQVSPSQLLDHVRLDLNTFVDTGVAEFSPYDEAEEAPLWQSQQPLGAVIHIDMKLFGSNWGNLQDGSVVVADSTPGKWVFSTIWTVADLDHPVSGNRQFGYWLQADGSHIFYTTGADRITEIEDIPLDTALGLVFGSAHKLWLSLQQKLVQFVNDHQGTAENLKRATISKRHDWSEARSELHSPTVDWLP